MDLATFKDMVLFLAIISTVKLNHDRTDPFRFAINLFISAFESALNATLYIGRSRCWKL